MLESIGIYVHIVAESSQEKKCRLTTCSRLTLRGATYFIVCLLRRKNSVALTASETCAPLVQNAADHHQAAGAVAEKKAAPKRALRKAGLSMNVTINIYGDVHIHCDCCNECGVYANDLEESPKAPYEDAPDTEDDSEETELSIAEAEAVVKAVAELLFPFLPAEIDEGGGAHEGI